MTHAEQEVPQSFYQEIDLGLSQGIRYLLSTAENGLCKEFHQLGHGPTDVWMTVWAGNVLAEIGQVPEEMVTATLALRKSSGGWGYNQLTTADADVTAQTIRFLRKVGYKNDALYEEAEKFILAHQNSDGGISSYLPEDIAAMGYTGGGWSDSHPCVSAGVLYQITDSRAKEKIAHYLRNHISQHGPASYWWSTTRYISAELGLEDATPVDTTDVFDVALELTRKSKRGILDIEGTALLLSFQQPDGRFPSTKKMILPRPHHSLQDVMSGSIPDLEVVIDGRSLLTTPVALLALHQQKALLIS